ncbi:MAG: hypothetical protein JWP00_4587 [Chloroflexi bacterium]|jgi:hypothetical protein|nr:hypothetical protein [Chloroflexota bacterium]
MVDWREQLKNIFRTDLELLEKKRIEEEQARLDKHEAAIFFSSVVIPAFEKIRLEFKNYRKQIEIYKEEDYIEARVKSHLGFTEYTYKISVERRKPVILTHSDVKDDSPKILSKLHPATATIDEISQEYLAEHFVEQYGQYKKYFRDKI